METPEAEQPPPLTQPEVSEEHVDIIIDSKDQDAPKVRVTEEESKPVANGGLQTPKSSPAVSPAPSTASSSSAPTPVPVPRSGQNGSLGKRTPERKSTGGDAETPSPYINGGIVNRFSYSGSMASESMDMSVNRESMSVTSRVSRRFTFVASDLVSRGNIPPPSHYKVLPLKWACLVSGLCRGGE